LILDTIILGRELITTAVGLDTTRTTLLGVAGMTVAWAGVVLAAVHIH